VPAVLAKHRIGAQDRARLGGGVFEGVPMIRVLIVLVLGLGLSACQPSATGDLPTRVPDRSEVPASYDWSFVAHGGSGDLDFGDGDWAEGVSLFHASCLPDSQSVNLSWGESSDAVLTAGTATGTFRANQVVPTDDAVIRALMDTGALAVGLNGEDMVLTGKAAGRAQLAAFLDYCTTPAAPAAETAV